MIAHNNAIKTIEYQIYILFLRKIHQPCQLFWTH